MAGHNDRSMREGTPRKEPFCPSKALQKPRPVHWSRDKVFVGEEKAHQVKAALAAAVQVPAHVPACVLYNQKGGSSPHITDEER